MTKDKLLGSALLLTGFIAALPVSAQAILGTRNEQVIGHAAPMGTTVIQRDGEPPRFFGTGTPGTMGSFLEDVEITTLAFQIPDFNPNDLGSHIYHVGMFSENGHGSGTAWPDRNGYLEFDLRLQPGQEPMKTFVYSVHAETGVVEVFIDQNDMSLNTAVTLLTNLQLNANVGPRIAGPDMERIARMNRHFSQGPPEIGMQRRLGLYGDYLSLEDIQEQIFQQTRCNVELDVDVFYLASCD